MILLKKKINCIRNIKVKTFTLLYNYLCIPIIVNIFQCQYLYIIHFLDSFIATLLTASLNIFNFELIVITSLLLLILQRAIVLFFLLPNKRVSSS